MTWTMNSFWRAIVCVLLACCVVVASTWARERGPMREIGVGQLPREAVHTLDLIKKGGPFPFKRDGTAFGNRERRLPVHEQGYYREYTVPTPGARDRGARRIVAGRHAEFYYTEDHYETFRRIRE